MLSPYLPSLLSLLNGFILLVLGAVATYWWKQYDARQKAAAETASDKKQWRDGRLAAEKALGEALAAERQDRVKWQLENAGDWERVVDILKEFGEVQRLLAVVATTSQHHATEIAALNRRLDESTKHLNEFILRHVKTAS